MALVGLWAGWLALRRRDLTTQRPFLWAVALATPFGFLAIEAGWMVTELRGHHPRRADGVRAVRGRGLRRRRMGSAGLGVAQARAAGIGPERDRSGVGSEPRLAHSRDRAAVHLFSGRVRAHRDRPPHPADAHADRHRAARLGVRISELWRRGWTCIRDQESRHPDAAWHQRWSRGVRKRGTRDG